MQEHFPLEGLLVTWFTLLLNLSSLNLLLVQTVHTAFENLLFFLGTPPYILQQSLCPGN